MVKQTAGRDSLGDFAPQFAQLNDDVLFGRVWNQEGLSLKLRSILTVTALVSKGLIDSSFQYHLTTAKQNGVTKSEMAAILTHLAFYAGWPNAWAAFRMAVEVYQDGDGADGGLFGLGAPNEAFAQYFIGNSYLKPLTDPKQTVWPTSPLSPDAGTTGTSTRRPRAVDRFCCVPTAGVGIRSGARRPENSIPAMWLPFRQA